LWVLYLDWGDDIKLDLKEISLEGMDWIYMAENSDKLVGYCERSNEHLGSIN